LLCEEESETPLKLIYTNIKKRIRSLLPAKKDREIPNCPSVFQKTDPFFDVRVNSALNGHLQLFGQPPHLLQVVARGLRCSAQEGVEFFPSLGVNVIIMVICLVCCASKLENWWFTTNVQQCCILERVTRDRCYDF
jgi:hypothetical protein